MAKFKKYEWELTIKKISTWLISILCNKLLDSLPIIKCHNNNIRLCAIVCIFNSLLLLIIHSHKRLLSKISYKDITRIAEKMQKIRNFLFLNPHWIIFKIKLKWNNKSCNRVAKIIRSLSVLKVMMRMKRIRFKL